MRSFNQKGANHNGVSFSGCYLNVFSCIKLIPKKKQALVEFDDIESAKKLVDSSQVVYDSLLFLFPMLSIPFQQA